LDYYSQFDADLAESVKLKKLAPRKAIYYLVSTFAEYFHNYPQIMVISQTYEVLSNDPELKAKAKGIFLYWSNLIKSLIDDAKESGEISQCTDSEKLSDIILGSFHAICLKWRLCGYNFPLKEYVLSSLQMILDAFANKS